ncbi:TetR/AcrR family transcriptional regulator [Liquorilactobacillus satsumensis]|uniref:AcrR family transcriptional regulator n=1 Tax=Liquorilactobacillus satsumensis DSM 16230 = JCM 12392 TaxID=1423801 RepID=A0A0R1UUH5_9LACO|nr:TetR/AcrR family transcriptional regulator [Liquorilactobacillus satsumensis]KRL96845.1 AcrR family transcriptional regulator [Liquorilactobacillus satsumensis DSM 16230 = JCM 12392]MCC7666414.1 TetR/AcrR family transcriptional regulator [Liquorilactobacillus satsumensis]MCP9313006.1 TetR/AcrR family transcriptional regulator [Liquorilactobacillus satsumensis]MCP9328952.1 TetR/AcrR family transcriptional regulator [Liquorilactobacillus satsumensis]MCP9357661.1 TetR/AcrR family transcription
MGERRRGKTLENAILAAVWVELQQQGYQKLTISAVAKQAQTNKNTIYRRWENKVELVFAAIQQHAPKLTLATPNTGSLEGDLKQLLGFLTPVLETVPQETWKQLLPEALSTFSADGNYLNGLVKAINEDNFITLQVKKIIENARKRHEHVRSSVTVDQLTLPALLVVNQILISGRLAQSKIDSLVDEILLPIYIKAAK